MTRRGATGPRTSCASAAAACGILPAGILADTRDQTANDPPSLDVHEDVYDTTSAPFRHSCLYTESDLCLPRKLRHHVDGIGGKGEGTAGFMLRLRGCRPPTRNRNVAATATHLGHHFPLHSSSYHQGQTPEVLSIA